MDKSWLQKSWLSQEYRNGVEQFLNFAFEKASEYGMILCPCLRCANIDWHMHEVVLEHLICIGFLPDYINWYFDGEDIPSRSCSRGHPSFSLHNQHDTIRQDDLGTIPPSFSSHSGQNPNRQNDMEGMLQDAFNMHNQHFHNFSPQNDGFNYSNVEMNDCHTFERVVGEE
ncbi:hypothetical protein REPUB_Repub07fG0183100 [Reevesia pubescens]